MKNNHFLFFARVVFLIFLFGATGNAVSDDGISMEDANDRFKHLGKRGPELFAIPTPGETYNEITGSIGHTTTDMRLEGNGLLSFDVQRVFEPKPAEYAYALGSMSLNVPHISFESITSVWPSALTCSAWEAGGGEVFNDIKFQHTGGTVSLIHKMQVHAGARSSYPVSGNPADAEYISVDNWLLDCVGDEYRVRSPNGVSYYFNAIVGEENYVRKRTIHNLYNESIASTPAFRHYKIYVHRIERMNSKLQFVYEQSPQTVDPGNPYLNEQHGQNFRVRPPLHFEAQFHQSLLTGRLEKKRRLIRIELRAGNENAANAAQTENQFLYFTYRGEAGVCPGLLHSIHSNTASVSKVQYDYEAVEGNVKAIAAPHSRCVLRHVRRNQHSNPLNNTLKRAWSFEYGAEGLGTYYYPDSGARGQWRDYYGESVSTLPLRTVVTPTGAKTTYEYAWGHTCDWQDSHDNYSDNPLSSCSGGNLVKVPIVAKRSISATTGDDQGTPANDVITQNTTFHYARIDGSYRVERKIQNEETIQRLVFGRINHTKVPLGPLSAENKTHQYVDSNRLVVYELLDATSPSTPALVSMSNFYTESLLFPVSMDRSPATTHNKNTNPPPTNYASWHKNRYMYLFENRRINLIRSLIKIDGIEYETKYNAYDAFNNPTAIAEIHRVNGVSEQRNIAAAYDNNHGAKSVYFVGAIKNKQTTSGESFQLVDTYTYNTNGLLSSKTIGGFKTSYSYHYNGNIKQVIDGRNKFELRKNYWRGIPRSVTDRDGKETTRDVNNFGRMTRETDPAGVKTTYTYNHHGYYDRLSRIKLNQSGTYYTDRTYAYAQYTDPGSTWTYKADRENVHNKYRKTTKYDSLGRVVHIVEQDFTGPTVNRIQRFSYDKLGRLKFKGQVRKDWSTAYGTHYEYDNYGRIKYIRYPLATSPAIQYCHGPTCADADNFSEAGPVKDGYAIRDQKGYVTVHNYRAFGKPTNKELVEIRQEIRPGSFNAKQDDVVITTINRNKVGFIKSVVQKGENSPALTRSYTPYATAGSTTFLVKSETHPEFGTKTVDQYDQNGNVTTARNFNNAQTTYIYDPMDRLRYAQNPGATGATAGVPTTEYRYKDNGLLEKVIQGNRVWDYSYNDINLLTEEKLSIDSETFTIQYGYDAFAQINQITYPEGAGATGRVVNYEKSGFGQAKSVQGFATGIKYHPTGKVSEINFENGTRFSSTEDTYQRPDVWRTEDSAASAYFHFRYHYDERSNVTQINNYFPPNGGSLTNLQYDGLNRLTRADASNLWGIGRFSYDPIGNIDKMYVGGNDRNYTYTNNQLTEVDSNQALSNYGDISYDANGNMTKTNLADYTFDQLNRLVVSDDGSVVLTNTYDGHNMRVKGVTNRDGQISTTYYVYNRAGQLLHELDSETGESRDHIQLNGRTIATIGSHNFVDSDNDGMPDYFERQHGLNAYADDSMLDDDKDGRSNLVEYLYGHLPNDADTDNDGIADGDDSELPPFMPMLEQPGGVDLTPIYKYLLE